MYNLSETAIEILIIRVFAIPLRPTIFQVQYLHGFYVLHPSYRITLIFFSCEYKTQCFLQKYISKEWSKQNGTQLFPEYHIDTTFLLTTLFQNSLKWMVLNNFKLNYTVKIRHTEFLLISFHDLQMFMKMTFFFVDKEIGWKSLNGQNVIWQGECSSSRFPTDSLYLLKNGIFTSKTKNRYFQSTRMAKPIRINNFYIFNPLFEFGAQSSPRYGNGAESQYWANYSRDGPCVHAHLYLAPINNN